MPWDKITVYCYPDGIITSLVGPFNGNRHDSGMLNDSRVVDVLKDSFEGVGNRRMCLYGDQAYAIMLFLLRPFQGSNLTPMQHKFNKIMSLNRIAVEWSFGKIINTFVFLGYKKNLKMLFQPVGKMYIVGTILTNCHTSLYYSQVSIYFNCYPPSLEDYLTFQ